MNDLKRENKTSFNLRFVPVTGYRGAYMHQKADNRAKLYYIHKDRIGLNESWHREYQANGHPKTLKNYLNDTKKVVKKKTTKAMQKKAEDRVIGEAVVVVDEHTTMEDLQELGKRMEERFGWTCVQIHLHKDEGYLGERRDDMKHREGKYNLHAHMFFITTDLKTGKSWKRKKEDGSEMQNITAEALNMTRGIRKSDRKDVLEETFDVVEFKFGEIKRKTNELNAKKESLEHQVGELESNKKATENSLSRVRGDLNNANSELMRVSNELAGMENTRNELNQMKDELKDVLEKKREATDALIDAKFDLDDVEDDKEKALKALNGVKEELDRVKGERDNVRKEVNELRAGYEKTLNSFTKPKIDEFVGKHTKKGWLSDEVNWEGVLNDYSKSASSYIAKLEAGIQERDKTIHQKEEENGKLLWEFFDELNAIKDGLVEALGGLFASFFDEMREFFGSKTKNLLSMSISLWNGDEWRSKGKGHIYTADKDRGKLLINGETIEERNSRLSQELEQEIEQEKKQKQEQEEQKRIQRQKKNRGFRL